jgi:hemerythrin-like domain-containing protein
MAYPGRGSEGDAAMRGIETLQDEHTGVLTVLTQLDRAVDAAQRGSPVPAAIFSDIQEFFAVFVDRCHHAKEEQALFPLLGPAGAALSERLEEEHVTGRRLARAYADAVAGYAASPATAPDLARAARDYAAFLRRHIELETSELFPLMERTLTAAQDDALVRKFDEIEEQQIGPGTHERLHGMIDTLAPRIDRVSAGGGR